MRVEKLGARDVNRTFVRKSLEFNAWCIDDHHYSSYAYSQGLQYVYTR